ncbi:MAG: Zn-ribbon domain-containing OB-fold protein [Dehalococcoidia bacterium]|nr:Zn-ribbon domain-containing OB-fold protein [Dehalococcoidia bacterium]
MEYKLTSKMFAEGLKENKLLGLKCRKCGSFTAPPKKVCMECTSEDLDIVQLSGKGEVRTFTVIRVPPEGLDAPYVIGMVELDEGPWLMGNIVDVNPDKASMELIGTRVRAGHRVLPGDKFSAGEMVAVTFSPEK